MTSSNTFLQHLGSVALTRLRLFYAFVLIFVFAATTASQGQTLQPDTPSGFDPGTISIFAGNGTLTPDGNPATSSAFNAYPQAVAVDSQGNVYVGDQSGDLYVIYAGSKNIPEILAEVTTQASPAVTLVEGDIYQVASLTSQCGFNAPPDCGEGQPASQAEFSDITNLFIDASDNVYVTDTGASVVRRIDHASAIVTTVAGLLNTPGTPPSSGTTAAQNATLSFPNDAKVDGAGNIYIADSGNGIVSVVYLNKPVPPVLTTEGISPAVGNIYPVAGIPVDFCGAQGTCGDDGPALNATFAYPLSVDIDSNGNIYIADAGSAFAIPIIGGTIRLVYGGANPIPPLLKIVTGSPVAGNIYAIAGTESAACAAAPCGDGGPALQAQLNNPAYVKVDSSGNGDIYIADEFNNTIRKVDAAGYISTIAGTETPNAPASSPTGSGGPATSAGFNSPSSLTFDAPGNLYVVDQYNKVVWEALAALPQTITFNPLQPVTYGAPPIALTATASSGLPVSYSVTGPATLSGSNLVITGAGTIQITASQQGNTQYAAAPSITQSLTVDKALLTVTADDKSKLFGTPNPAFTASYSGFVNGDKQQTALTGQPAFSTTATTNSDAGTYPIVVSQGTLAAASYNFAFVNGTLTITGSTTQTITFNPLPPVTYGQVPTLVLNATASSNLPVTYTVVSGPGKISGSVLTITGGGTIQIAANQFGNNTYVSAPTVTQSLTVKPAPLTVTAPNVTLPYGTTVNPAQFPAPTVTGFVNGDPSTIVSGNAQYSTPAAGTPQPGSYPIQVSQGTLVLAPGYGSNYTFASFVSGTLTVTTASQTINFTQIPALTVYGNANGAITLTATASSGLPVTFTVTGPAIFVANQNTTNPSSGINTVGLYTIGVGVVTVTATQPGNTVYGVAPQVPQTFTVQPALLTVSAVNVTRTYGVPNPTLNYQINGFVNGDGDIPSVITGIPALNTAATQQSPAGTYPIVITQGSLVAPNYSFNLVNGTLTILPAGNYTLTASPPTLTIQSGHSAQTTITLTPNNDYQGTITLSCGSLPADVTCIFSPATYSFNGNANGATELGLQGTLTINTLGGQTVVGALSEPAAPSGGPLFAFLVPAGLTGLLITGRRRGSKGTRKWYLLAVLTLSLGALTLMSCGSSNTPALAAPGTTTIMVNGVDAQNVSASTPLTVTIQ